MRWSRTLVLPVLLLLLLAACGGPGATDGNGNGNGNGGDESQAEATAAPESEESEDDGGNGGNGGNGGFDGDLEQLAEDLTPPNSTESSRTEAGGVIFLLWESTDSPEDLDEWYEDAIADVGLEVFSRTAAAGSFSYIFGIEEGSNFGGVVSIAPTGTGSGSAVGLQIGEAES